MNPTSIALGLGGALLGIVVGILPGLSATLVHRAADHAHDQAAGERRDPGPDLLLRRRASTAARAPRSCSTSRAPPPTPRPAPTATRWRSSGEAGPRDRHRHLGRVHGHAVRRDLPGAVHAGAGRGRAVVRCLRVLLARALRRRRSPARIVGDDPLKGWLMGALGLFVAQIGQEGLYAHDRFTFGWDELAGGIALIPALVGAFGLAEVLTDARRSDRAQAGRREGLGAAALSRGRPVLAHRPALGRDRRAHRPPARRRRGRRAPGCRTPRPRRASKEKRAVRQGLDRRPDGGRDRRHGVDSRRTSSRRWRSASRARHRRRC